MGYDNIFKTDKRLERTLYGDSIYGNQKKKRKTLTFGQRIFFWEHPKLCSKICSICHERITKMSELELDHTKAHIKGGTKLAFAHKLCNKIKSSGSLGKAQKMMGIKSKPKKKTTTKKKKRKSRKTSQNIFGTSNLKSLLKFRI